MTGAHELASQSARLRRLLRRHAASAAASAVLAGLIAHRLSDFTGIRYTSTDDMALGIVAYPMAEAVERFASAFDLALAIAREHGRFFLLSPVGSVVNSVWLNRPPPGALYDVLSLGTLLVASLLAAHAVARYWSQSAGWFYLLCFWALLPQLWSHLPPAFLGASPFFPVVFALFAVVSLHRYATTDRRVWLVAALASYAASLLAWEMFLALSTGLFAAAVLHVQGAHRWPRGRTLAVAGSAGVLLVAYVGAYAIWRLEYPTRYTGHVADVGNVGAIAVTFVRYLVGGLIFTYWKTDYGVGFSDAVTGVTSTLLHTRHVGSLLQHATVLDWLMAAVSGGLAGGLLWRQRARLAVLPAGGILLAGAWVAITAVAPYAFTHKYQQWVLTHGDVAYMGSRWAYFGLLLGGVGLAVALLQLPGRLRPVAAPVVALLGAVTVGLGSVSASGLNHAVARTLRIQTGKWQALHEVLDCAPLAARIAGQTVVAPRLWDYVQYASFPTEYAAYWDTYYRSRSGQPVVFRPHADNGDSVPLQFDYRLTHKGELLAVLLLTPDAEGGAARLHLLSANGQALKVGAPPGVVLGYAEGRPACGGRLTTHAVAGGPLELVEVAVTQPGREVLGTMRHVTGSPYTITDGRGALIDFSSNGDGLGYARYGWYPPEPWGTWSHGPRAELRLPLQSPPSEDLVLVARATALIPRTPARQKVTVRIGGTIVAHWSFTRHRPPQTLRAYVPARLLAQGGPLRIAFEIAQPVSPHELGASEDRRPLGLGLVSLQLLTPKADAPILAPGREITFNAGGDGAQYLRAGWSDPEPWGIWSEDDPAELLLRIPATTSSEMTLVVRVRAFVPAAPPEQVVTVLANDGVLARWTFTRRTGSVERRIPIATSRLDEGRMLRLVFRITHPTTPRSMGLGADLRSLGLGLESLRLEARASARP